ncbi:MAG: hypothetical protein V1662_05950 [Candidatus Omnitrophota bacterium]
MDKHAQEYKRWKEKYPEEILLYQVGIFYRIMFEDARRVADKLGLKLMVKGEAGCPVELCGFPESGLDKYVGRLARLGFSAAVCRQARGEDGSVRREIAEVVRCSMCAE